MFVEPRADGTSELTVEVSPEEAMGLRDVSRVSGKSVDELGRLFFTETFLGTSSEFEDFRAAEAFGHALENGVEFALGKRTDETE